MAVFKPLKFENEIVEFPRVKDPTKYPACVSFGNTSMRANRY